MTTIPRHTRNDSLKGGGYGVEKALSEICPRLLVGIALQTRGYLEVTNAAKNGVEDSASPTLFTRRGSKIAKPTKSEVFKGKAHNESAFLILCEKVFKSPLPFFQNFDEFWVKNVHILY